MKPPYEIFKFPTCRGSFVLGTGCGKCEKCSWEKAQPLCKENAETFNKAQPNVRQTSEPVAYGWLDKAGVFLCLTESDDPRAVPLYTHPSASKADALLAALTEIVRTAAPLCRAVYGHAQFTEYRQPLLKAFDKLDEAIQQAEKNQ